MNKFGIETGRLNSNEAHISNTPIEKLKEYHRQQLINIEQQYIKILQDPITF